MVDTNRTLHHPIDAGIHTNYSSAWRMAAKTCAESAPLSKDASSTVMWRSLMANSAPARARRQRSAGDVGVVTGGSAFVRSMPAIRDHPGSLVVGVNCQIAHVGRVRAILDDALLGVLAVLFEPHCHGRGNAPPGR
jgi:hypothetical protein